MAKRGRPAKFATISDLDEALQNQIDEAILSHADKTIVEIFREFGLASRGLLLNTFAKYCAELRKQNKQERINAILVKQADAVPPTWEELDAMARHEALAKLRIGDAKMFELVLLSKSRRKHDKLALETQAENRAAEKHRVFMEEKKKTIRTELDAASNGGTKELSIGEVWDVIDKAFKGETN